MVGLGMETKRNPESLGSNFCTLLPSQGPRQEDAAMQGWVKSPPWSLESLLPQEQGFWVAFRSILSPLGVNGICSALPLIQMYY